MSAGSEALEASVIDQTCGIVESNRLGGEADSGNGENLTSTSDIVFIGGSSRYPVGSDLRGRSRALQINCRTEPHIAAAKSADPWGTGGKSFWTMTFATQERGDSQLPNIEDMVEDVEGYDNFIKAVNLRMAKTIDPSKY